MNTSNDFQGLSNDFRGLSVLSSSFGSNFERRDYTSIEGLLFSDRNGMEKMHVPKVHITPNFGIYEDQKRNMLLSIDNNVSSSKFVGIRVTNDGKCVGYGNAEDSNMMDTESFVSTSLQGHCVSGIHGNHSPTRTSKSSFTNVCQGLGLHSPPGQKIGDEYPFNLDLSVPPTATSEQHMSVIGDSGNEEDTEKRCSLGDQDWPENVVPFPIPSDMDILVQNESVLSSMEHRDQDFSISVPMTPGNDFPVQTSMEGISEQRHSQSPFPQTLGYCDEHFDQRGFDASLPEETGSTSHLDWGEFDWS